MGTAFCSTCCCQVTPTKDGKCPSCELVIGPPNRPQASDCPSLGELERLSGDLQHDVQDRVAIHLKNCSACQQRLSALADRSGPTIDVSTRTADHVQPSKFGADPVPSRIGKYELDRLLGEGGFGTVHHAVDTALDRNVAVKILKRTVTSKRKRRELQPDEYRKRAEAFREEARILARLEHPNIVPVYDLDELEDGRWYIVSKFIDGCSLAERTADARLSPAQSCEIVATVATALHCAHTQRLVHRDIKPANILLDANDKPYVVDFGLALGDDDYGSLTAVQGGTPAYMSPEQARLEGHLVDSRSDIFSLGIVLYELLTGEHPFRGPQNRDVLDRIKTLDPRPPRMLAGDVSKELERICLKALEKRPADRYHTALDLAEDLRRADVKPRAMLFYDQKHKTAAELIARQLGQNGVDVGLTQADGRERQSARTGALQLLERCNSCILLFGAEAAEVCNHEGLWSAIDGRSSDDGGFQVIPILLPGAERPGRGDLPMALVTTTWVEFDRTLDDKAALGQLLDRVRGVASRRRPERVDDKIGPYRGLEAFEPADEPFFFGREALTQWLASELRARTELGRNRFLAIVGASGSGKSSLALAGLIPALRQDRIHGSSQWTVVRCRPGRDPVESLAVALQANPTLRRSDTLPPIDELMQKIRENKETLHLTSRVALHNEPDSCRVVVLVDQFEEIFTQCDREDLRRCVIDNLTHAAVVTHGRTLVVLTMRADFYGKCASYPELAAMLSSHQELLGPIRQRELRQVIERPARIVGCQLEPGLTELLLQAANHQPGTLPLLQYTLAQLWQRRQGHRLTIAAYKDLGGLEGAIEKQANQLYSQLTAAEKEVCRRLFLRLLAPGDEGVADSRRRVRRGELDQSGEFDSVIDKLIAARLLTARGNDRAEETTLEIAHETLATAWSQLRSWLDADRESRIALHRLGQSAREWQQRGRDRSFLLRGRRLKQAKTWAASHASDLAAGETEFLRASQRAANRRRAWSAMLAIGLIGSAAAAVLVGRSMNDSAQRNYSEKLAARSAEVRREYPQRGLLLAVEAVNAWKDAGISPVTSAEQSLRDALQGIGGLPLNGHHGPVTALAVSPDGAWFATASDDHEVRLWKTSRLGPPVQHAVLSGHQDAVKSVAFSPDGNRLVTASLDGTARVWDMQAQDPSRDVVVLPCKSPVLALAVSRDGKWLVTAGWDNTPRLWDLESSNPSVRSELLNGHSGHVLELAAGGNWLATASQDGNVRLWNWREMAESWAANRDLQSTWQLDRHRAPITAIGFSPDGQTLATGSADGATYRWSLGAEKAPIPLELKAHTSDILAMAFSPDGRWLITGSADHAARLWNLAEPEEASVEFSGHQSAVTSLALSPDSRWLITASEDKTARRWDLTNPSANPIVFRGHDQAVRAVAVDPGGQWLLTASDDADARCWDLTADYDSVDPIIFRAHDGNVLGIALDTRRVRLFTASRDNTVRAWDWQTLTTPWPEREAFSYTAEFAQHRVAVTALAIDPSGRWLVTGAGDGSLLRWELGDPSAEPIPFATPHKSTVTAIAISPKGRWLVTAGRDRRLLRRDLEDPLADPTSFTGHSGAVASLAIRPDGDWLVAGSWDAELLAWDLSAPSNPPSEFTQPPGSGGGDVIGALDFSPDGSWLVSGDSMDMTVQLWEFESKSPIGPKLKCDAPVTSIRFIADQRGVVAGFATATDDFTVQLWNLKGEQVSASTVLKGHQDRIAAIEVSRDGRWLVSASHDGTVRLWRLRLDDLLEQASRAVGRGFTKDEWEQEFPGKRYDHDR